MLKASYLSKLYNFLLFPLRAILPNETSFLKKIGLISLKEERMRQVLPLCRKRLLDIGCGYNELARRHRASGFSGIGIDIYQWSGVDALCDTADLPFKNEEFETVCFVASLNHILKRDITIREAKRVLKRGGRVIVTMINPFVGFLCHKLTIKDFDRDIRGLKKGEKNGLSEDSILKMFYAMGFKLEIRKKFVYGLNNLFVFIKE